MGLKTYVGVLGDPAKIERYDREFYSILKNDNNDITFQLIGASEKEVNKEHVGEMFSNFGKELSGLKFNPLSILPKTRIIDHYSSRIGLFPSQRNQLISGPNFVFAPYPINSSSKYLQLKSKLTISVFDKITNHNILPLAYCPIGGKAAKRTNSNDATIEFLISQFYKVRKNPWFRWFYLEAGSGESKLDNQLIQNVLKAQINSITNKPLNEEIPSNKDNSRIIVPKSIYGGGIKTLKDLDDILDPKGMSKIIPECIIIGNISEENINMTYRLIDRVNELNELPAIYAF